MATAKRRPPRRVRPKGDAPPLPILTPVVEVPVVMPVATVTNWAALSAIVVPTIVLIASAIGAPLDQKAMLTLVSAWGILSGFIIWVRNTYFRNSVTITSLDSITVKALMVKAAMRRRSR